MKRVSSKLSTAVGAVFLGGNLWAGAAASAADLRFSFGGSVEQGFTPVAANAGYEAKTGYGFVTPAATPEAPSIFAVDVPEGNYEVVLRFGDPNKTTSTTVKAEARRLMLEKVDTQPGQFETRTITVAVRRPEISGGGKVSLKKGEDASADWDEHLTLEFNGKQPGVASVEVKPATDAPTLFIAGDSTVTDQPREPWSSWAQALPRFFAPGIAVSDNAWSGLTLASFEGQHRLEKILSQLKKGDYVLVQFGHNDQKDKGKDAGPYTSYKANLRKYITAIREKGGNPVLVTPMERRRWDGNTPKPTLSDFATAVRQIGWEQSVPVIDLNAMSLKLYEALGPEGSKSLFVYAPANTYPGQKDALHDDTHHNVFGGYELARCIVEGIKANVPELAAHLAKDVGTFDPSHPDAPQKFDIPRTPSTAAPIEKPAGS